MNNENNKNINPENKDMVELNPEALEDVTGGGIKEIVAATTLAAMAMTGNTVSAFGLANALAEDTAAHIEEAPAQDSFGEAYAGDTAEAIEVETDNDVAIADVDEAIPEVDEADADLADADEDIALSALKAGDGEVQEAVAEVEFDLDDPDGEGAIIDEGATDPEQTMKDLIDMTVNETKDQGLYVTLNSVFATLADNAEAISDPETGVVEMDGNQIVNSIYDKLAENFDNTPEQLMGAIQAAAMRADDQGYIDALGGDAALVSMAARESAMKAGMSEKDASMIGIEGTLAIIQTACPAIAPFVKPFTDLFGSLFGGGVNIEKKFDEINQHLDAMETP